MRNLLTALVLAALAPACGARTSFFDPSDYPDGYVPTDAADVGVDVPRDVPLMCATGLSVCGARCVNTAADPLNCGRCGVLCAAGSVCSAGRCTTAPCQSPLTNCNGACTSLQFDPLNCGACNRRCTGTSTCNNGACQSFCPMPLAQCGMLCTDLSRDPSNCGGCAVSCLGAPCVNGLCQSICPTGQTRCAEGCVDVRTDPRNCGGCGRACPGGAVCFNGTCGARPVYAEFHVDALTADRCVTVEHNTVTGDDRGGIALTSREVLYTGDTTTGHFDPQTLAATPLPMLLEPMIQDLETQRVFLLASGGVPLRVGSTVLDSLLIVDPARGLTTGAIRLSMPVTLGSPTGSAIGLFSGYGRIAVAAESGVYDINPNTGAVAFIAAASPPPHTACETFGFWGVAETRGGELWLDYVQDGNTIARWNPANGVIEGFARFMSLSDMCTFTVSLDRQRWYFHHEGGAQFRSGDETLGYCDARLGVVALPGYTRSVPTIPWVDACSAPGAQVALLPLQDDTFTTLMLPFAFQYWGAGFMPGAPVNVTTNGWLSLTTIGSAQLGGTIPMMGDANGVMAVYWGDNYTRSTGICAATVGAAPNRSFVVEWNDEHFCCMEDPGVHLTYEAILHEGSNVIDFLYNTMAGAREQLVGIEDPTGTRGLTCGGATPCTITTGSRLRFTPTP